MPFLRILLLCLFCLDLAACAGVQVSSMDTEKYMEQRRGDVLTSGRLSLHSASALQVLGLEAKTCVKDGAACRSALLDAQGLSDEKKWTSLSELWLQEAMKRERREKDGMAAVEAYLEAARFAYACLFLAPSPMAERALEERPSQVRDYYNFAVQQASMLMFRILKGAGHDVPVFKTPSGWTVRLGRPEDHPRLPEDLIPASALTFKGIRNRYRRDGLGAEMVAVMPEEPLNGAEWSRMRYPSLTVLMDFSAEDAERLLREKNACVNIFDPFETKSVSMRGCHVPLAGNFTAGYGLWLARSSFASQSLGTLLGSSDMLERAHVYLMQPFQPERKTVVMIHGLASSPEAWINVANEIMGDEELVEKYQIWQVYYPTSFPIAINNFEIRQALERTIAHYGKGRDAPALRDMLLVGHSMGGVLSRLMISSSGERLWERLMEGKKADGKLLRRAREELKNYLFFKPMPQIGRAVFIAAPHRGTPFADNAIARFAAGLVSLPVRLVKGIIQPAVSLIAPELGDKASRSVNGIANLSAKDSFIQAAADLPLSPSVPFHSIIGNDTPGMPLPESGDGIVPYSSAHRDGAASEKVIPSGHSVQETPEAILEIRRIMHEHLRSQAGKEAARPKAPARR